MEPPGYRIVPDPYSLWATPTASRRQRLPITRFSPYGLSFLPEGESLRVGDEVELIIASESAELAPQTYRVAASAALSPLERTEVHVEPAATDPARGRALLELLRGLDGEGVAMPGPQPTVEAIVDPTRIRSLLAALFADRRRAIVRTGSERHRVSRPARLNPDYRILVEWQPGELPSAPPFEVEVAGPYCDYRFVISGRSMGPTPQLPTPTRVTRVRRRYQRRCEPPPHTIVRFAHPVWPEIVIERPVRDLSLTGLSLATRLEDDLLYPGLHLDEVYLGWKRGPQLRLSATVRHVSAGVHGVGETCGLSVDTFASADAAAWRAEVTDLLHPHTRVGQPWHDDVWEVFVASGYLQLSDKQTGEFEPVRSAFVDANDKLAMAPGLGCQVTWPTRERVEATISFIKPWTHAYLVSQLARYNDARPLSVAGNDVLRDIYMRGYEHVHQDPDLRWHVAYVQDAAHFSKTIHLEFPLRFADACALPFLAWEGRCRDMSAPRPGVVRPASSSDVTRLLETVAATRPAAYAEANDLVAERFDLVDLSTQWAAAELVRERGVLVAQVNGEAAAAAVLELADDGLHLFGLLDLVRLFAWREEGVTVFPDLLRAAALWYGDRGKRKFVYFDETLHEHAAAAGLTNLGGATLTIMPAALVPDILDHVFEVTAPRGAPLVM